MTLPSKRDLFIAAYIARGWAVDIAVASADLLLASDSYRQGNTPESSYASWPPLLPISPLTTPLATVTPPTNATNPNPPTEGN